MYFYPYSSAFVITDQIFTNYGGHTGTSVAAQRNAAYWMAERMASEDIHSFFQSTVITGSFSFAWKGEYVLEHNFINSINRVRFLDSKDEPLLIVSGNDYKDYFCLVDDERGLMQTLFPQGILDTNKMEFVYTCGLISGTSYNPDILLGLTTYADLMLNEILGYGNEAPGDIGVQSFRNVNYYETRIPLMRTNFGTSARAQFAYKQFLNYKKRKWVGL